MFQFSYKYARNDLISRFVNNRTFAIHFFFVAVVVVVQFILRLFENCWLSVFAAHRASECFSSISHFTNNSSNNQFDKNSNNNRVPSKATTIIR